MTTNKHTRTSRTPVTPYKRIPQSLLSKDERKRQTESLRAYRVNGGDEPA